MSELTDYGLNRLKHRPTYYSHFFAGWYYLYRKVEYRDSNGRKHCTKKAFIDADSGHNMVASRSVLPIEQAAEELNKAAICYFSKKAGESGKIRRLREEHRGQLPSYAWPGGYPLFYVDKENSVLCPSCANKDTTGIALVEYDINYEDTDLYCCECSKRIESAYGDDEEEEA